MAEFRSRSVPWGVTQRDKRSPDPNAPAGRMVPLNHSGPLPWVQLRNATYNTLVFRKMVGRIAPNARDGDLVSVYDRDAQPFGAGLLNMRSQIGLRMLAFGHTDLDESFLVQRITAAAELRRNRLRLPDRCDAYRVVHAEGDGLPGLIVDCLGEAIAVELFGLSMFRRIDEIERIFRTLFAPKQFVVRADERIQKAEGFTLPTGPADDRRSAVVTENGLRFQVDLAAGHKTGFFCDQRENRMALTAFTAGADVLDMCSYSGGFGLYAAMKGHAKHVTCVDLDEQAIALARRNMNLNAAPRGLVDTVHADSFTYLRQMQTNDRFFDAVVLDPPKFIATREEFAEGRKKYFDLNKLGLATVKSGGYFVTCSCSGLMGVDEFTSMLRGAARSARRRVQILSMTGAGADHPVMLDCPESAYLKCAWCRVL